VVEGSEWRVLWCGAACEGAVLTRFLMGDRRYGQVPLVLGRLQEG
jgi:hypothetical protein